MPNTPIPTYAKVSSLSHWTKFFHPSNGIFRSPSTQGETIEHLDIDLRYVEHEFDDPTPAAAPGSHTSRTAKEREANHHEFFTNPLALPRVVRLTLRGGEYVQDDDTRMDSLAEVLLAVNPVEVHWVNAATDPSEQLTFATHLVHPAVIAAGENWSRNGSLRKLVVQGGFPVPNLTAPTPFSLTPAATPCPSPGPARSTFGSLSMSRPTSPAHPSGKFPHGLSSGLPALSTTKPKPIDAERLKAREERRRLADYSLKPRFEYAFGTWAVDDLRWRLDGRYSPACMVSIVTHLFQAIGTTFRSSSRKVDVDLPAAITFTSIPKGIIDELASLPEKLELDTEIGEYLRDVLFVSLGQTSCAVARLWETPEAEDDISKERQGLKIKAEMLLLQNAEMNFELVSLAELVGSPSGGTTKDQGQGQGKTESLNVPIGSNGQDSEFSSPATSDNSILPGESEAPTEDEKEAVTPGLGVLALVEPSDIVARENNKGETVGNPSLESS